MTLGDNVLGERIRPYIDNLAAQPSGGRILLKRMDEPGPLRHRVQLEDVDFAPWQRDSAQHRSGAR